MPTPTRPRAVYRLTGESSALFPEAHFVVGGTASRAGLAELLEMWRPRYLLVDEIETIARMKDNAVLLHLMENEEVVVTKHGKRLRIPMTVSIFAAGNDARKLPRAFVSRLGGPESILRLRAYRREEFIEVSTKVLTEREGVVENLARACAEAAAAVGSRDVRYAVRRATTVPNLRKTSGVGDRGPS